MEVKNIHYTGLELFCFYFLWAIFLILIPFYGFGVLFEFSAVTQGDVGSYFSPLLGLSVTLGQLVLSIWCVVQITRRRKPLSQMFAALIGSTVVMGFIYFGGCAIMGPLRF